MNQTILTFSKNFKYTLIANIFSLFFNMILVLILPKRIDTINYAYWQLYQLYAQYIGYVTFGITDGVYLRYGGDEYEDLPKPLFRTQFLFLLISNLLFDIVLLSVYWQNVTDDNKLLIVVLTCITGILYVPRTLITNTFQATNRIKEYATITIYEKLSVLLIVVMMMLAGLTSFSNYILADLMGKILTMIYAIILAKDLVFGKLPPLKDATRETKANISVGSKVLIANLSSILINGIVRVFIERKWGLVVFGQISFSFSISNILITIILAVSIVFFPVLKRMKRDQYANVYLRIREKMIIPLAGLMLLYFPARGILNLWLPSYASSLKFMALLFPISLYESNMKLLGNNYLKAMRKENYLMINNIISVILTIILSVVGAYVFESLIMTVFTIFIVYAVRCILAEKYLAKILSVNTDKDIILEFILSLIFILSGWFLSVPLATLVYLGAYLVYLYFKRVHLYAILRYIKGAIKK